MPLEIRGAHFLIRNAQLVRKTRLEQALKVSRCEMRFRTLSIIGSVRRWLRSTRKV